MMETGMQQAHTNIMQQQPAFLTVNSLYRDFKFPVLTNVNDCDLSATQPTWPTTCVHPRFKGVGWGPLFWAWIQPAIDQLYRPAITQENDTIILGIVPTVLLSRYGLLSCSVGMVDEPAPDSDCGNFSFVKSNNFKFWVDRLSLFKAGCFYMCIGTVWHCIWHIHCICFGKVNSNSWCIQIF